MKVLVANRGEIACRILRTLRETGVPSVAVYSDADADAPYVWLADEAVRLGETTSYLDGHKLLAAARSVGATAIHPGYGFLSQSAKFAGECRNAGVRFIGPPPEAMAALGDKRAARALAQKLGVPVIPGAPECDSLAAAKAGAEAVGYPILLKAVGGGGGKGMRRVSSPAELAEAFDAARREARQAFADGRLLVEKYVEPARHIEVQILADGKRAMVLGERECSLQRRYQKLIEESPSPALQPETREALFESAATLAETVGYANAGTVEFLVAPDGSHYFLEVNSRLQVEHPVTEMRGGVDLVALQVELAHGGSLPQQPVEMRGHAIEARLNAEDPQNGFLPATGRVLMLDWPERPNLRIDPGVDEGSVVSAHYDSLLAKVIAWGPDREQARRRLVAGLKETTLLGVTTNQAFLIDLLESPWFADGETYISSVEKRTWNTIPVPTQILEAARVAVKHQPSASNEDAARRRGEDRYSPWRTLGAFRM